VRPGHAPGCGVHLFFLSRRGPGGAQENPYAELRSEAVGVGAGAGAFPALPTGVPS
jgi:hypothetical protein